MMRLRKLVHHRSGDYTQVSLNLILKSYSMKFLKVCVVSEELLTLSTLGKIFSR